MTLIWALYVCACGYEQPVQVRIDQRVTPEHDCALKQRHTGERREPLGSAAPAS